MTEKLLSDGQEFFIDRPKKAAHKQMPLSKSGKFCWYQQNPAHEKGADQSKCLLTIQLLLASTKPANACGVRDCGTPGQALTGGLPLRVTVVTRTSLILVLHDSRSTPNYTVFRGVISSFDIVDSPLCLLVFRSAISKMLAVLQRSQNLNQLVRFWIIA